LGWKDYLPVLNPIHLSTLRECVRTGSFAEAGRILGYTASAVSQQMALLERATGLVLFERSAQSVRPSTVAHALVAHSAPVLEALARLERDTQQMAQGERGRLHIAGFPSANVDLLPPVLSDLAGEYPDVELFLSEGEPGDLLGQVLSGVVDAAVVFEYSTRPVVWPGGLAQSFIDTDPLTMIVPADHELANATDVSIASFADSNWISTGPATEGAESLRMLAAEAGFEPRVVFRSNNYYAVQEFVVRGLGVAIVPHLSLRPDVCRLPILDLKVERRISILSRYENSNPLLQRFIARVASEARRRHDPGTR
jgi:Transcriptional regulator